MASPAGRTRGVGLGVALSFSDQFAILGRSEPRTAGSIDAPSVRGGRGSLAPEDSHVLDQLSDSVETLAPFRADGGLKAH